MQVLRKEHPNPQWERENWINLNGEWEFDFDFGRTALDRELHKGGRLGQKINVPFCPESKLSGIAYKDFIPAAVYRKVININKSQLDGRVMLHFGAVDYSAVVFVNSEEVCRHNGGYTPFYADITSNLREGDNVVFVYITDDTRNKLQCSGKQSKKYYSSECDYTRTTGIWQTVWLEFTPKNYIISADYETEANNGYVVIKGKTNGSGVIKINTEFEGESTGNTEVYSNGVFSAVIKLTKCKLWDIGQGNLYNITLEFEDDIVHSYFGIRSISVQGMKFLLNNRPVFQRLVLDQGYYEDGIYTAPSEAALVNDIKISMNMGFNGARLHQKVFEPRFLYQCDKMGYIVWAEYGSWGFDHSTEESLPTFLNEWLEVIQRDKNHPSIIVWCPFNETWDYVEKNYKNKLLSTTYKVTKAADPTRLCVDASGNYHVITDIFDVHDYEQNPELFRNAYLKIKDGVVDDRINRDGGLKNNQKYNGEPVFVSEFGGTAWNADGGWGYGENPKTEEEFILRYKGLADALLDNPDIMGFCYTQLYDIEQEKNGLYTYSRKPKFNPELFKEINNKIAKTETEK